MDEALGAADEPDSTAFAAVSAITRAVLDADAAAAEEEPLAAEELAEIADAVEVTDADEEAAVEVASLAADAETRITVAGVPKFPLEEVAVEDAAALETELEEDACVP